MAVVYDVKEINNSGLLRVSEVHEIYWQEAGNPKGIPVLKLHSRLGLFGHEKHRRYFDPEKYRIIQFDQRGGGRSKPQAELKENSTTNLVEDIERLRNMFEIERFLLAGHGWGSTLALLYAESYPDHVSGMLLSGIYLMREQDNNWIFEPGGASEIYPDKWSDYYDYYFRNRLDSGEGLIDFYHRMINSNYSELQAESVTTFTNWQESINHFSGEISDRAVSAAHLNEIDIARGRIQTHYLKNKGFIQPNQIISEANRIQKIPVRTVSGRFDATTPVGQAWALKRALPHMELVIVPNAGHSSSEEKVEEKLIEFADRFAEELKT